MKLDYILIKKIRKLKQYRHSLFIFKTLPELKKKKLKHLLVYTAGQYLHE